jgi:hypothetical protein
MTRKKAIRGITVQIRNTVALPGRAETTAELLRHLRALFRDLFADENFITLLQAESRKMIPEYLRKVLHEAQTRDDSA